MAISGTPVKAVVFDIGATLVTGPPVAPNKVIAGLMGNVTAAEIASVIMTTQLDSAEHVCAVLESRFGRLSEGAAAGITDLWDSQASAASALDGAAETVLELKSRGLRVGLLSDIWNPYFASVEKALPEVIEAADAVVLSCRSGARKPSPENFIRVLASLRVEADEAVMVGDTYEHDILPALQLGMRTVWVLARPEREADFVVRVLNRELPAPTATVGRIAQAASLELFRVADPTPH